MWQMSTMRCHWPVYHQRTNATITRRMFNPLRDQIDPTIAAISTILIALSIVLLMLSQFLSRKKAE